MTVQEFEKAIAKKGMKPEEARLRHKNVVWFVCAATEDYDIVVYDQNGKALVLEHFDWPGDDDPFRIAEYTDADGNVVGVAINGIPAMRAESLDLDFE